MSEKTIGLAFADGRDPEDGWWLFDENGAQVTGDVVDETRSREEALDAGIPESVCDAFEKEHGSEAYEEYGLFCWLCDHHDLFRVNG